jgi:hypothetical protein
MPSEDESSSFDDPGPSFPFTADDFPDLPAVPPRGSFSAPASELLSWHAEVASAAMECLAARAAHHSASAAKQSAAMVFRAATDLEHGAELRVRAADRRRSKAWAQYSRLLSRVVVDSPPGTLSFTVASRKRARSPSVDAGGRSVDGMDVGQ